MTTLTLSRHARDRVVEFGIGLDVVTEIASRPDVTHRNKLGEAVCTSDRHPDWTVVLGRGDVVVTVLRRLRDRWEHDAVPPPRPAPSTSSLVVVEDARAVVAPRRVASGRRSAAVVPSSSAVVRRSVDPEALRLARELADGDLRRLVLNDDGSVSILNRPRPLR